MKFLFALLAGVVAFAAMAALVEHGAPWLSSAQAATLASLSGLLWFMVTGTVTDFLAESGPSEAVHRGRAALVTVVQERPASATISLLWGAIRIELPMLQPQQQTAWAAA